MLSQSVYGVDVYYHDSEDITIQYLKQNILYGQNNFNLLHRFILKKTTIIDCGCHIGTFAIPAALNKYGIIAIDGAKKNIECLEKTSLQFNSIKVLCEILSNNKHKCSFSRDYGPFGALIKNEDGDLTSNTIDNICKDVDVCAIKFDLEGGEVNALLGAKQTIEKHKPPMLVEINGHCLRKFSNDKPGDVFKILNDFGYNIYIVQGLPTTPTNTHMINSNKTFPFCVMDVICLHKDNMLYYPKMKEVLELTDQEISYLLQQNYQKSNEDCKKYFESL